jgi:predicted nucleic acid-binding protein
LILVDTSVWVDHLRRGNAALAARLENGDVISHPFVIGEISLGSLRHRDAVLGLLSELPTASLVPHTDVIALVSRLELAGRGIGWVDAHLLASAIVDHAYLWTLDRRLAAVARSAKAWIDA